MTFILCLPHLLLPLLNHNFDREGPGGADVYILCLEEFRSVGMLPPGGSSMFQILPLAKQIVRDSSRIISRIRSCCGTARLGAMEGLKNDTVDK